MCGIGFVSPRFPGARANGLPTFKDLLLEQLRYDRREAAPSGDIAHEDELCPGLFLRVRPSGLKSYSRLQGAREGGISPSGWLLTGKAHRITLSTWPHVALREARDKPRQALQAASEGRDPRQPSGKST
ncbi:Arm DNA-binding domain-containing protein [Bradyrhizobium glycinis]|uniref:Arm DNA-binding domain-containing protein n=1 Tax=Bradyrhizobium glycinis TaxID=2751812 RepID=UPI0018D925E8|nr:DUF4102 domain-containing protein [Bradyrhizobium glycinis]